MYVSQAGGSPEREREREGCTDLTCSGFNITKLLNNCYHDPPCVVMLGLMSDDNVTCCVSGDGDLPGPHCKLLLTAMNDFIYS